MKTWFIVDVESDGPCPGIYSMVSLGAVRLDRALRTSFRGTFAPLVGASYNPEALAISGTTREQHLLVHDKPLVTMLRFKQWINDCAQGSKPVFVSDNPAFDFAWCNYYFHLFCGKNPFGYSARRIGDLYAGLVKDASRSGEWRQLRKTPADHDPLNDAMGMAEAILAMVDEMGLRIEGLG